MSGTHSISVNTETGEVTSTVPGSSRPTDPNSPPRRWGNFDEGDRPFDSGPYTRSSRGVHSIQFDGMGGAKIETTDTLQERTGGDPGLKPTRGVVETGRNNVGRHTPPHLLTEKDFVTINGIETSVTVAESFGLIRKLMAGGYEDVNAPLVSASGHPQGYEQSDPQGHQSIDHKPDLIRDLEADATGDYPAEALSDARMENLTQAIVDSTDDALRRRAVTEVVESGEFSDHTIKSVATIMGMNEASAAQAVQSIQAAYTHQLSEGLSKAGLSDEVTQADFHAWLTETKPQDAKAARRALAEKSTARGYIKHVSDYVAALGTRSPEVAVEVAQASGVSARVHQGDALVTIPGVGEVPWFVALKQGFVSVRGAQR